MTGAYINREETSRDGGKKRTQSSVEGYHRWRVEDNEKNKKRKRTHRCLKGSLLEGWFSELDGDDWKGEKSQ